MSEPSLVLYFRCSPEERSVFDTLTAAEREHRNEPTLSRSAILRELLWDAVVAREEELGTSLGYELEVVA